MRSPRNNSEKRDLSTPVYSPTWLGMTFLFILSLCHLAPPQILAQEANSDHSTIGTPYIRSYPPDEYQSDAQNWAIIQDQYGLMYFGNGQGIMEYDGVTWRLIETENKTVVRSLDIDEHNRIFVGAYGEIGYLAPNDIGQLQYVSLLPQLDEQYHDFKDVWYTIVTDHGIYFGSQKYIFHWDGQEMQVWQTKTYFLYVARVNDEIYVREWKTGLLQMVSDSLEMAPVGEVFQRVRVSEMLSYPAQENNGQDKVLISTQTEGFLMYDGLSLEPFPTNFDDLLFAARIYKVILLSNGNYAIATMQEGLIIMDREGRMLHHLNKASGLQNNTVWKLFEDKQGGLWTGMNIGISRVEINNPLTYFTDREGLEGAVFNIVRHQGTIYAASSSGVYFLSEGQFKPVSGITPQAWALLPMGELLLGGTFQGLFEIKGGQAQKVYPSYIFSLCRTQQDPNRLFIGVNNALVSMYKTEGQWEREGVIQGTIQEIRDVVETSSGKLWLTTRYQGLIQVDFSDGFTLEPKITRFDTLQGLPAGDRVAAFHTREGLRFITPKGLYRFEEEQQQFLPDNSLVKGFSGQDPIFWAAPDQNGNFWLLIHQGLRLRYCPSTDGWLLYLG